MADDKIVQKLHIKLDITESNNIILEVAHLGLNVQETLGLLDLIKDEVIETERATREGGKFFDFHGNTKDEE